MSAFCDLHFPIDLQPSQRLSGYVHTWMASSSFSTKTLRLRNKDTTTCCKRKAENYNQYCVCCNEKKKLSPTWTDGSAPGGQKARSHSLTHLFTHILTHSLTHARTHTCTHSLTHSHTHTLTHSLTHSRTHALTHSLTHSSSLCRVAHKARPSACHFNP